jgi:prepilin-type N-terminal cleavage/methylation domain-containing protein
LTLIELMVVVAIVGVLTSVAVLSYRNTPGSVHGFAQQIAGELDSARLRAVASKRWQRVEIQPMQIATWEATTEGMADPVAWQLVRTFYAPREVAVISMSPLTHIVANDSVPAAGAGLNGAVEFRPDGAAAAAATIFVGDDNDVSHVRVAVYRATGSAYVFSEW